MSDLHFPTNYFDDKLQEQIENGMGFHPGTPTTAPLHERLRQLFIETATAVNQGIPPGRDKSLVITHLEDALMRCSRAVAINLAPLGGERTDNTLRT